MPVKYKLMYYGGRGRGEIIRQVLSFGGVEFEDVRFEHDEWLEKYKPITPFGQCPLLEIDNGKEKITLCQSHAIAAYLGKLFGCAGDTLLEQCRADMLTDSMMDYIVMPCVYIRREKDEKEKAAKLKKFEEEELPTALKNFEKQLILNNGGDGYFVGSKISYADMQFTHWMSWIVGGIKVVPPLEKYPKLQALVRRVEKHPKISAWMKKRPVTEL